jgi:Domain of unknown function (DUF4112)
MSGAGKADPPRSPREPREPPERTPPLAAAAPRHHEPASAAPPWVHGLVRAMDEAFPIPGTKIRVGWDAIVGFLLPGVGDAASALSHITLLFFAFRAGVSKVVLARMVLNVAIDELWGSVPIVGDLFDAGFRANRKNLELIDRNKHTRRGTTTSDYLVVYGAIASVIGIVLLPLILLGLLGGALFAWLR